jgi:hypothetical protein
MVAASLISALARSFAAGDQTFEGIHTRASHLLGKRWHWLASLVLRYVEFRSGSTRPRHRDVVRFLLQDRGFRRACVTHRDQLSIVSWLAEPARMQPVQAAREWNLPSLETVGDLAAWFSLDTADLEWFADLKGLCAKLNHSPLQHYHYRILPKRTGGVRLIESPKHNLKALQRRILSSILDRVPAHAAVHGFVKGRSIATFAAPHAGRQVLLRLDLENFFPAFPAARAQALFRTLGYPEAVADLLGGLCSNAMPRSVWRNRPLEIDTVRWHEAQLLYMRPHLPQGAPTSPAITNLTAFRLDCRLTGLARSAGAVYTRYADDLAFSGDAEFGRVVDRFAAHAAAIALEEGFGVNHHKTRILRRGARQILAGVVVNEKLNLRRRDLEILEAILTNCLRFGLESQNREGLPDFHAHLQGRIGFVEMINPTKARRLRALLEKVRSE